MWVIFTVIAALAQALRNAQQKMLSRHLSALGTTFGRYVWAIPLALSYLIILEIVNPAGLPNFNQNFYLSVFGAASTQIVATIFMALLFKRRNYMVGVGLTKSEALMAAIFGVAFFGAIISPFGWVGITIGAFALWILQGTNSFRDVDIISLCLGLGAGALFGFTTLFVRFASLQLNTPFIHSATWVLFAVVVMQTFMLFGFMLIYARNTLRQMLQHKILVFRTSLAGSIASFCWFVAVSLEEAALVKTLGQVEMVFAIILSKHLIKERTILREKIGLVLIGLSAILVMLS